MSGNSRDRRRVRRVRAREDALWRAAHVEEVARAVAWLRHEEVPTAEFAGHSDEKGALIFRSRKDTLSIFGASFTRRELTVFLSAKGVLPNIPSAPHELVPLR